MIFASDLDRTLIYSAAFINEAMKDIAAIEFKEEIPLSYITENAKNKLELISKKVNFIPVTTRSLEQYLRLKFFNEEINPKYAVVANGGIILENKQVDLKWKAIIAEKLANIISTKELMSSFGELLVHENIKSARICDDIFIYIVLYDKRMDGEYIEKLTEFCKAEGYNVVKNGRKLYVLPDFLNKWEPLKYIMEKEKESILISAGDSILDFPMLINSNKGLIPYHGELNTDYSAITHGNENFVFTEDMGLYCSDELLELAIKFSV